MLQPVPPVDVLISAFPQQDVQVGEGSFKWGLMHFSLLPNLPFTFTT